MARAKNNGNGRLDEAMTALTKAQAILVQAQASLVENQAVMLGRMAASREGARSDLRAAKHLRLPARQTRFLPASVSVQIQTARLASYGSRLRSSRSLISSRSAPASSPSTMPSGLSSPGSPLEGQPC